MRTVQRNKLSFPSIRLYFWKQRYRLVHPLLACVMNATVLFTFFLLLHLNNSQMSDQALVVLMHQG